VRVRTLHPTSLQILTISTCRNAPVSPVVPRDSKLLLKFCVVFYEDFTLLNIIELDFFSVRFYDKKKFMKLVLKLLFLTVVFICYFCVNLFDLFAA